jgi:hypothetical protein
MAHRNDEFIVAVRAEEFTDVFGKDESIYLVFFLEVVLNVLG